MKRALTIGLLTAAIGATSPLAAFGGDANDSMGLADTDRTPYYERGPRIIHVPQPDEGDEDIDTHASVDLTDREPLSSELDEKMIEPRPRQLRHAAPRPQRRTDLRPPRKPVSAPPPAGPRRAVLSAPPQRAGELSPVHPTPRFESTPEANEKFATPPETAVTAETPPPGYTPPLAPPDAADAAADQ